jgi:hypothetical protein
MAPPSRAMAPPKAGPASEMRSPLFVSSLPPTASLESKVLLVSMSAPMPATAPPFPSPMKPTPVPPVA